MPDQIRVVMFKDGDIWVAQCLEFDIGAQGKDLDQLHARLVIAINLELQESLKVNGKPFAGIDPAPAQYERMWGQRSGAFKPVRPLRVGDDGQTVDLEIALAA